MRSQLCCFHGFWARFFDKSGTEPNVNFMVVTLTDIIHNRSIKKSEEDIPVPPLLKSAALWGMFPIKILRGLYENLLLVLFVNRLFSFNQQ